MSVLTERDVRELLDMKSCIEAMTEVLASLARGELFQPHRSIVRPPGAEGLFGLMPAYRGGPASTWALKEIAVVPSNPSRGLDTHMGGVLLHDGETGELEGLRAIARVCPEEHALDPPREEHMGPCLHELGKQQSQ